MKLNMNTSFTQNTFSQSLLILVDSEQVQQAAATYSITDLAKLIEATQFKASLNETLPLIAQIDAAPNTALVGVAKASELNPNKLAKIAQSKSRAVSFLFIALSLRLVSHIIIAPFFLFVKCFGIKYIGNL